MRLKKLTLSGFKSFADKTTLQFDHGVTCIVGPNGCGKSNIADAFRWVLGEQSAKSLRGAKMPDIIFSGTHKRKPLNLAEVSLTLTEIAGKLPVHYEEVTITRKLHRNGDSDYFLNDQPIRLKDLQALFLDTGVGKNAFSIFEQGKLDQVISFTTQERRAIFEEAAGIVRFLQRKKESLKRLEESKTDLSRLRDIYKEVENQVSILSAQSKKAEAYKDLEGELNTLNKRLFTAKWKAIETKKEALIQKQEEEDKECKLLKDSNAAIEKEAAEKRKELHVLEKELIKKNEETIFFGGKKELFEKSAESCQKQIDEAKQKLERAHEELKELSSSKLRRTEVFKTLSSSEMKLDEAFAAYESDFQLDLSALKEQETLTTLLRQESLNKQRLHIAALKEVHVAESDLKELAVKLENCFERQKEMEHKQKLFQSETKKNETLIQEKKAALESLALFIDEQKKELNQIEEAIKAIALEKQTLKIKEQEALQNLTASKAKEHTLKKLQESYEGFSSGSKILLKESEDSKSPLYKVITPFYHYFDLSKKEMPFLSASLRSYAQTLVVHSEKEFEQVFEFAKARKLSDFSLLCLDWLFPGQEKEHFPLHFLKSISKEKTFYTLLEAWRKKSIQKGWSSDGFFIDEAGVVFCLKEQENQLFQRESDLKALKVEIEAQEKVLAASAFALTEQEKMAAALQLKRLECDKHHRKEEMKLVEINFSYQKVVADQERENKEADKRKAILEALSNEHLNLSEKKTNLEKHLSKVKTDLEEAKKKQEESLLLLSQKEEALNLLIKAKNVKNQKKQELSSERQKLIQEKLLLESKQEDEARQHARLEKLLIEEKEKIETFYIDAKRFEKDLEELNLSLKQIEKEKERFSKEAASLQALLKGLEEKNDALKEKFRRAEHSLALFKMQIEQFEVAQEQLEADFLSNYSLPLSESLNQEFAASPFSLEQIEKKIHRLKSSLKELGEVNFIAIEEVKEQKERLCFLDGQLKDIEEAKLELSTLIHELDQESRLLFRQTFEEIKKNFKKNFEILFSGGEADLELVDSSDMLEAGIEITARPPGKQTRTITLLSGGEKCLTALALLFAIFEVRPSPFCILDEIDAPLDDANVERFANVVRHFAHCCQFLIITHNKKTMSIGDLLFGISMEEKGVSKLLSLEFDSSPATIQK